MKAVWKYSLETESLRILQCAHNIASGFYRKNGFNLDFYENKPKNASVVTFPNLAYKNIPRFWKKVLTQVDISTIPTKANEKLLAQTKSLLEETNYPKPNYTHIQNTWKKAQDEIINTIYKVIPSANKAIRKITICPTLFGTTTSFSLHNKFPADFYLYLRYDQDIYTITEALLTSLTRKFNSYKNIKRWASSEFLVDWLISDSLIGSVLKKYQPKTSWLPTIKLVTEKQNAKLARKTEDFYNTLGVSLPAKVFSVNGKVPLYNKQPISGLTGKEKEILVAMINSSKNHITYEKIGEILFKDEDNFSFYAISKAVQRLRDRLEKNSISATHIQALRGKGYCLKN